MLKKLLLNAFAWSLFAAGGCMGWLYFRWMTLRAKRRFGRVKIRNGWNENTREEFPDQIELALELLEKHDPRRAMMVQQRIRMIMDNPSIGYHAAYFSAHKICAVDYDTVRATHVGTFALEGLTQQRLTEELASLLVHEATHGRIYDQGINYREDNYVQTEQICRRQEYFFRKRVCDGRVDLLGVPVNWKRATHFTQQNESYLKLWTQSPWERLKERIMLASAAVDQLDSENRQLSSASINARAKEQIDASWSNQCATTDVDNFRDGTPSLSAATLTHAGYGYLSVGMLRAAIRCYDRASQITTLRTLDNWCYAEALYQTRHYEASIRRWKLIEKEHPETSRSWQFSALIALERFAEARVCLDELQESEVVQTDESWARHCNRYRVCLHCAEGDYAGAAQILESCTEDGPLDFDDEDVEALYTLVPLVAHRTEDAALFATSMAQLVEARENWLADRKDSVSRRTAFVLNSDTELKDDGCLGRIVELLVRRDADATKEQVAKAKRLMVKMQAAVKRDLFCGSEGVLQGLFNGTTTLLGNENLATRNIDWEQLDDEDRMEGNWFVVDAQVSRAFLRNGRLEDDTLDVWLHEGDGFLALVPADSMQPNWSNTPSTMSLDNRRVIQGSATSPGKSQSD